MCVSVVRRVAASFTVESHSRPQLHAVLGAGGCCLLQGCREDPITYPLELLGTGRIGCSGYRGPPTLFKNYAPGIRPVLFSRYSSVCFFPEMTGISLGLGIALSLRN